MVFATGFECESAAEWQPARESDITVNQRFDAMVEHGFNAVILDRNVFAFVPGMSNDDPDYLGDWHWVPDTKSALLGWLGY